MKTLTRPCAGLLLLIMITGCTSVKRFKSADYKGPDNTLVNMTLFGASLDQAGAEPDWKNLWDLSADAQTQMIRIYNERYPDNQQFTLALNQQYMMDGFGPPADFTSRDLKMVFTISKEKDYTVIGKNGSRFSPADRIEVVKFSLQIPAEYNLRFTGWNRYSTEYGEVEIADVSFSRSIDLSADVSSEYVDGGLKSSSSRKEDQALRSRYLKLNGSISALRLDMEAEGCREIDLAGNVVVDVSLEFEGFPERITLPVYASGNGDFPLKLSFADVMVPRMKDAPDSIMATLEMEYIYRHVESGWKSYQEWDDRVAYFSGKVSKQVPLFCRDDYLPPLYCLGSEEKEAEAIRVRSASGMDYPLQFLNYREAQRFLDALRGRASAQGDPDRVSTQADPEIRMPVVIGDCSLLYGDQPLTRAMVSSMKNLRVLPVY